MTDKAIEAAIEALQEYIKDYACYWAQNPTQQDAYVYHAIKSFIKAYETAKWQDISIKPEDGQYVLGAKHIKGRWFCEVMRYSKRFDRLVGDMGGAKVWRPLPQSPGRRGW